ANEYFEKYRHKLPNYSVRMTNLAAALLKPQLRALEERIANFNCRFDQVSEALEQLPGVRVVRSLPQVRTINDCVQFHLPFTHQQALTFVQQCKEAGILIALFGDVTNARNFRTWEFAEVPELPQTEKIISVVCDMSLPALFDDQDWEIILAAITEIYSTIAKEQAEKLIQAPFLQSA
ncbi:MAG TPA: DegT/DnrJ/EryC1/StrS family aminotransferase, partial [Allocoleopsis sp.]